MFYEAFANLSASLLITSRAFVLNGEHASMLTYEVGKNIKAKEHSNSKSAE
jgi:hypothetical protein